MTKLLRCLYALGLLGLLQACSQGKPAGSHRDTPTGEQPKTAKEFQVDLLLEEQCMPQDFLSATGASYRDAQYQLVLEGNITSLASLASFRDPVLLVRWYSKAHTLLATKEYPLRALIPVQHTVHFDFKTSAPKSVAMVTMGISSATPVE